ncbi:MAG: LysR family transcriptional regulator, partial [Candidatus Latescibacteria bacterium]|nr:LysR family transcriptional regulator [Candidatus Latescibacterota bacterium]
MLSAIFDHPFDHPICRAPCPLRINAAAPFSIGLLSFSTHCDNATGARFSLIESRKTEKFFVFGSDILFTYTTMELRHLRYFAMAAEEENISRASARLHISQPAVSRQIKDLEEELGVQLFERLRDGLKLTAAGNRALVHARQILRKAAELEEAMHPFRGQHTTLTLAVGYIPTALPAG